MTVMKGKNTGSMTCAGPGMNPVFKDGGGPPGYLQQG